MNNTEDRIKTIEGKIAQAMEASAMFPGTGRFVVGFSGGADSMCLLHYLFRRFPVVAAHVNHGLRGEEADADEKFAESWCRKNGVPFFVKHADIAVLSQEMGMGEE